MIIHLPYTGLTCYFRFSRQLLPFLFLLLAFKSDAALISYDVTRQTAVSYNSIIPTGTSVTSWRNGTNTDDNLSNSQPIGFDFSYAGGMYNSFLVSTNGFITFNVLTPSNGTGTQPYSSVNANLVGQNSPLTIAPFYEDMVCQGNAHLLSSLNASILYEVSGTPGNRVLTIEWVGMEIFNNPGPNLNFQVKLFEATGNIEFIYGAMQGFNGASNVLYSYNTGMNADVISSTPAAGELLSQVTHNTRNFSHTGVSPLNTVPDCYTSLNFIPGAYTPYVPVSMVPVNDNPGNAIVLPVNSLPCTDLCGTYYTSANTVPQFAAVCSGIADDDVWFSFTATNANTTIRVAGSGGYDAVIGLYDGSQTFIACQDATANGMIETLSMSTLTVGSVYLVRVFHKQFGSGTSGMFSICINAAPSPPANDECANAISLPVTGTVSFSPGTSTLAATASSGIPVCNAAGTNADDDVWYSFTAVNTTAVVSVQGLTGFNAGVQLFSGSCASLVSLDCVNNFGNGQIETITQQGLTIGQQYFIRVFHAPSGAGTGMFNISVSGVAPGCVTYMEPANATINVPATGIMLRWNRVENANHYTVILDSINPPVNQIAVNITDTMVHSGPLSLGQTYYWKVIPGNATNTASGCFQQVFATDPLAHLVRVKMFLESFYTGSQTMLPVIDPVAHDTITDTVSVSIAHPLTRTIIYTSKALLNTSGIAYSYFPQPLWGSDYYLVVKHRNSLETWSSLTFPLIDPDTIYDFTDFASRAYGSNQLEIEPGVFSIHSGDVNQDGFINHADVVKVEISALQFSEGYLPEDLNGDEIIESVDYSFIENKSVQNKAVIRP